MPCFAENKTQKISYLLRRNNPNKPDRLNLFVEYNHNQYYLLLILVVRYFAPKHYVILKDRKNEHKRSFSDCSGSYQWGNNTTPHLK